MGDEAFKKTVGLADMHGTVVELSAYCLDAADALEESIK